MVINVESFDDIEKASQKLLSLSQTYTEIYTQLMQSASTMGTAWEGADNQAFVEQITGFTEELKSMADKLSVSSEALHKEKQNYVERMDGNITNVKKLAN